MILIWKHTAYRVLKKKISEYFSIIKENLFRKAFS